MNREELAWAAGFFDGEGCVGISANKKTQLVLTASIAQTDRRVLDRFHAAVQGVGYINGPYSQKNPNHRAKWAWHISGFEGVQAVVAMLWTWLSPVKREDAKFAINAGREYFGACNEMKSIIAPRLLEERGSYRANRTLV